MSKRTESLPIPTNSTSISCPIVGAHFRPPAKQLLAGLPAGLVLSLVAEPTNQYDPKAIKVFIAGADISAAIEQNGAIPEWANRLAEQLDGTGFVIEEILTPGAQWQLGYIGDSDGKLMRDRGRPGNRELAEFATAHGLDGVEELQAELAFASDGQSMVRAEIR